MRTSEVRQGFNSRGKEKSMDVGSPARWFTDGLEKQAGTTVHAKVSSYRARLLLPRPGRRRCNKIGEKNNIHQRSNARKYYARSVKELSSSLSLSLSPSLFRSIRRFSTSHRSTFTPEIHPLPPRVYARAYKSTGVKALLLHASNENDIRANIPRRGFVDVHFHFNRSARGLVSLVFKCNAGWREGGGRPRETVGFTKRVPFAAFKRVFDAFSILDLEKSSGGQFSIRHIRNGPLSPLPRFFIAEGGIHREYPINFSA